MKYLTGFRKLAIISLLAVILIGMCSIKPASAATTGFTITMDCNGGIYSGKSIYTTTIYVSQDYGLVIKAVPTRSGYAFDGWYSAKSGGVKADATHQYSKVYAHWLSTIVLDANGGTIASTSSKTYSYKNSNEYQGIFSSKAAKENYVFGGWYEDKAGTVKATATKQYKSGTRLYAKWVANPKFAAISSRFNNSDNTNHIDRNFYSVCSGAGRCAYNYGHVARPGYYDINHSGIVGSMCTDAAICELMNRALAADGLLSGSCFFDIKDILAVNVSSSANKTKVGDILKTCAIDKHNSLRIALPYSLQAARSNSGKTNGELIDEKVNNLNGIKFKSNYFGVKGYIQKEYTFVLEKVSGLTKERLMTILNQHPEGLYVRYNGHSFVVSRYDDAGNLYYIDNGNSYILECNYSGILKASKDASGSEKNLISGICQVGYIKR